MKAQSRSAKQIQRSMGAHHDKEPLPHPCAVPRSSCSRRQKSPEQTGPLYEVHLCGRITGYPNLTAGCSDRRLWSVDSHFLGWSPISSGPLIATQRRHWIDSRGAARRDRACNSRYKAKEQGTRQQHDWIVCIAVSPLRNNFVQAQSKREAA
jgi:hypothetical protein